MFRYNSSAYGQKSLGELGILFWIKVAERRAQYSCDAALGN